MTYDQKEIANNIIYAVDEVTKLAKEADFRIDFDQALKISVNVMVVDALNDIYSTLSDK